MPFGKIVAINGANISISIQAPEDAGPIIDASERTLRHLSIVLPVSSKSDLDYAVQNIGKPVGFLVRNGRIQFGGTPELDRKKEGF